MFEDLLQNLRRLESGVKVRVNLPIDDDGFLDRVCPACGSDFKVDFEHWLNKVRDEAVYCPHCRAEAPGTEWNTAEQQEAIKAQAMRHLHGELTQAIDRDVRRFNAKQPRRSFVSLRMSHNPSIPPIVLPIEAAAKMRRTWECEKCGCRYASVGAAFFCPACGHNSAVTTFADAVEHVRLLVRSLLSIRGYLADEHDDDFAEDTIRRLRENALEDLVTAYQRYAESLFESSPNTSHLTARRNVFQTVDEASKLWHKGCGKGYEDLLSSNELADLRRYFQQRHLLAHKDGIVDQDYADKSGDNAYRSGQRIVIREEDVLRLADLLDGLAISLRNAIASSVEGGIDLEINA